MPGRMKVFLGMVLAGMLTLSPVEAQQTSPANDHLIVPGLRIGPFKLGANVKNLIGVFDPIDMNQINDGKVVVILWYSRTPGRRSTIVTFTTPECANTFTATLPKCKILEAYVTDDPGYVTAEGLHTGVLEKQVRGALGEPNRIITDGDSHALVYSSGILFHVSDKPGDNYQRVVEIYVRPPNCLTDVPCT